MVKFSLFHYSEFSGIIWKFRVLNPKWLRNCIIYLLLNKLTYSSIDHIPFREISKKDIPRIKTKAFIQLNDIIQSFFLSK